MKLISLLFCAGGLCAQVLVETPAGFVALGASYSMGTTNPGDFLDTRFQTPGLSMIPNIQIGGSGFAVRDITAAGFSVRFLPNAEGTYSASLSVGSFTAILRATAQAIVVLSSNGLALPRGAVIDFGVAEVGLAAEQTLRLENRSTRALTVASLVTNARIVEGPVLPLTLGAGQSVPLRIAVTPTALGFLEQVLEVDGRAFVLRATGTLPRLPPARLTTSADIITSGQQLKLRVEFTEPVRLPLAGTINLEFSGTDAAVRLGAGRQAAFNVPAGERQSQEILLQTGTQAGLITLRVQAPGLEMTREIRTEFAPILIDEAKVTREGSSIVVALTGFDNTRGTPSLNFRVLDRAGASLGQFSITPEAEWRNFFQASTLGGLFRLRAVFPVAGDASVVGAVAVEIANAVGKTDAGRLTLP